MTPRTHRTKRIAAGATLVLAAALVSGCSGGGDSDTPSPLDLASPPPPPPPPPPAPGGQVTISGTVTFESVPHNPAPDYRLDYDSAFPKAARGVLVEVVNGSGTVLDSDTTDLNGDYDVQVDPDTDVRVRVTARMVETGTPSWDIRVLDNTNGFASYVLQGTLASSGTTNSIRDLSAPSGWTAETVTGERAAAPFAILDGMYDAVQLILSANPNEDFDDLQVFWSVDNVPADAIDVAAGELTSSFYTGFFPSQGINGPTIAILGDATSDADEYDSHVIAHEFAHFVEDTISRSDSIGGAHSLFDRLDMRLAFGEGFGNSFAGMALDDPEYKDDFGTGPLDAFGFSVDVNNFVGSLPRGFFNEASIQAILWDLFDPTNDGVDVISGGFQPIYDVLSSATYTTQPDFTTIYAFISDFRDATVFADADIDALLNEQLIIGRGPQGTGETNTGPGTSSALPVYKTVSVNGPAVEVCSVENNDGGSTTLSNKFGVRSFLVFDLAANDSLTFTMAKTSGPTTRDPDFRIWENGQLTVVADSDAGETETRSVTLGAGSYRIETFDWCNTIPDDEGFGPGNGSFCNADSTNWASSCYDFTVTD